MPVNNSDDKEITDDRKKEWREFSMAIRASNEVLTGEPERIRFRTPEEIEAYEICI